MNTYWIIKTEKIRLGGWEMAVGVAKRGPERNDRKSVLFLLIVGEYFICLLDVGPNDTL